MASILYNTDGNEVRVEAIYVQQHLEQGYTAEPPAAKAEPAEATEEKPKRGRPPKQPVTETESESN